MQVQAVVHAGAGENMMNQMATFCLGERAHPLRHWSGRKGPGARDQVQATRHKQPGTSDYELLLIMHFLSDLWPL